MNLESQQKTTEPLRAEKISADKKPAPEAIDQKIGFPQDAKRVLKLARPRARKAADNSRAKRKTKVYKFIPPNGDFDYAGAIQHGKELQATLTRRLAPIVAHLALVQAQCLKARSGAANATGYQRNQQLADAVHKALGTIAQDKRLLLEIVLKDGERLCENVREFGIRLRVRLLLPPNYAAHKRS